MKEAEMYIINPIKNHLPGGRFFKNIISDAKILYKNPNKINLCVFASSLKAYFIIFDKKKIKIKNNKEIPRFLYHATYEKNYDSIMQNGIVSENNVYLSDDCRTAKDVLDGKDNYYGKLNHIKITADTEILKNLGIDVYKINRFNEYVTAEVPPQAIIKCENFVDRQTQ